jgi:hypothetical protein
MYSCIAGTTLQVVRSEKVKKQVNGHNQVTISDMLLFEHSLFTPLVHQSPHPLAHILWPWPNTLRYTPCALREMPLLPWPALPTSTIAACCPALPRTRHRTTRMQHSPQTTFVDRTHGVFERPDVWMASPACHTRTARCCTAAPRVYYRPGAVTSTLL